MSILYLLALAAVAFALVAATASAIVSVSRRPEWELHPARPTLHAVVTEERRLASLPFVGKERRHVAPAVAAPAEETLAA